MRDFRIDTFLEVCRYMNFTRASEALSITQPAVSQHIHYLENFYGVKLFEYEGKKMYLTDAGNTLYQAAITMKHDDLYLKQILQTSHKKKNNLVFGATLTIGEFVIAKGIKQYLSLYPDTEVRLLEGNTSKLLEKLNSGEIDFAIVEGNYSKREYDDLPYSQERYIPVCGKDYVFHSKPKKLADLLSERIIIRENGSGTRDIFEKNMEARNLEIRDFKYTVEIEGINAIKSLVEAGCGITFLYEAAVKKEQESGSLIEIKLEDFQVLHDFSFIWNRRSIFSEHYHEIYKILKTG